MPTYLYECKQCGQDVEVDHSIKESARKHHPHGGSCANCKGYGYTPVDRLTKEEPAVPCYQCNTTGYNCDGELKRLIAGGTSFALKGSGWTAKTYV